jgi:hypothetical protein
MERYTKIKKIITINCLKEKYLHRYEEIDSFEPIFLFPDGVMQIKQIKINLSNNDYLYLDIDEVINDFCIIPRKKMSSIIVEHKQKGFFKTTYTALTIEYSYKHQKQEEENN